MSKFIEANLVLVGTIVFNIDKIIMLERISADPNITKIFFDDGFTRVIDLPYAMMANLVIEK